MRGRLNVSDIKKIEKSSLSIYRDVHGLWNSNWKYYFSVIDLVLPYNETQLTFYDFRHNSFQCQASFVTYWQASGGLLAIRLYSCNKITTTWIQIFRQNWNGFFSNISHQMMILLTPIVSGAKTKWYKPKKSHEIGIRFTITDC